MDKKEEWANEVLNSLNGMKRAEPSTDLFDKISAKLPKNEAKIIPLKRLRWVAAAACLFIAVNVYVFNYQIKNKQEVSYSQTSTSTLLSNYSIYN